MFLLLSIRGTGSAAREDPKQSDCSEAWSKITQQGLQWKTRSFVEARKRVHLRWSFLAVEQIFADETNPVHDPNIRVINIPLNNKVSCVNVNGHFINCAISIMRLRHFFPRIKSMQWLILPCRHKNFKNVLPFSHSRCHQKPAPRT